ncbi:MAG: hypothetical protein GY719_11065 [bacterium]|nr:hypothetical protein [bacterium]
MTSVSYDFSFDYGYDADGALRPLLRLLVSNVAEPSNAVEIDAALDSGAERSLLNGRIGEALGIDVLRGPELSFSTMAGGLLPATLHRVRISHSDLGTFELELAFSTVEIQRNLLGRDFFDLVQIGFREHQLTFFVTPTP